MYAVGTKVVHPTYGAGTILSIQEKHIGGTSNAYYVIDASSESGALQVMVPVDQANEHGLRRVGDPSKLRRLLDSACEEPPEEFERDFRTRKAALSEKLNSGEFRKVVSAARTLFYMSTQLNLCQTDRRFMEQALDILGSELAAASGLDMPEAVEEIEGYLKEMCSEEGEQS